MHNHSHQHDHGHDHGHGHHHHHHAPEKMNMAFAIAVGLNSVFIFIEFFYAFMAHSSSLMADAGHNLGDVLALIFAWLANWLLTRKAQEKYSYGFRRTSILAALSNALLLVLTSALIAYEAIEKLIHPTMVHETIVIIVAAIGIVVNGVTALLFVRGSEHDLNLKAAFLHLAADAVISLGVVIAGCLILYTGWNWIDPVVGLLIVVTILLSTWGLLRDSVDLILDAVPGKVNLQAVREYLLSLSGVEAIHDLHIWGLSTVDVALTAHLVMPDRQLSDDEHREINCTLLEKFHINHVTIQVEQSHDHQLCGQVESC